MPSPPQSGFPLPCVVQLGFSGARHPFPDHPDPSALLEQLTADLTARFASLRSELQLRPGDFFCGIAQAAIGGDFAFARACADSGVPQRFFLPQKPHDFLHAAVPGDGADFDAEQRGQAAALLDSPHAIQVRVVSDSPDRTERFRDAMTELLRVSDVLICVLPAGAPPGPTDLGGTPDVLHHALERRKPVLELRVSADGDALKVVETRHHFERFVADPPQLPVELRGARCPTAGLPDSAAFLGAIRAHCGTEAERRKSVFVGMALVIIGLHLLAMVFATVAMATSHGPGAGHRAFPVFLAVLLGLEIPCLIVGLILHRWVHHSEHARVWAMSRLVERIGVSVLAIGDHPLYLRHLLLLPFPHRLRAMLRTINVLHLRSARNAHWRSARDQYVAQRLTGPEGEIPYYRKQLLAIQRWYDRTQLAFRICAFAAIGATLLKLIAILLSAFEGWTALDEALPALGGLAIVLPVFAVAALSWGLALSYEALLHTYRETYEFLTGELPRELPERSTTEGRRGHLHRLQTAQTQAEFEGLLIETEARLLGENLSWYYRQSFAEIA